MIVTNCGWAPLLSDMTNLYPPTHIPSFLGGDPKRNLGSGLATNSPLGGNPWVKNGRREWASSNPHLPLACAKWWGGGAHLHMEGGVGFDPWGISYHPPPSQQPPPSPQGRIGAGNYQTLPPAPIIVPVGLVALGGGGYPIGPPPATSLGSLGRLYTTVYAFSSALQGVLATGGVVALPSPSPTVPAGRVATLLLLHLRFACWVEGYGDLPPVWDDVGKGNFRM